MSDLLSNDEVDALLEEVSRGTVETDAGITAGVEVKAFDLTAQDRITRGRMPSLEMVNQRFARYFQIGLYTLLRRNLEVRVQEIRLLRFSEYQAAISVPSNINLVRVPQLDGTTLFVFDANLVLAYIDFYFGGRGHGGIETESREFTPTELGIVGKLLDQVFTDLSKAWETVAELHFEHLGQETNPQFANVVSPSEVVLVSSFEVELAEGASGMLDVVIPYSLLEPFRDSLDSGLQSDQAERHERWTVALAERLQSAEIEVRTVLAETRISLRALMRLRPGDIVPIEIPSTSLLSVNTTPIFSGRFGVSRGCNALQIAGPARLEDVTGSRL